MQVSLARSTRELRHAARITFLLTFLSAVAFAQNSARLSGTVSDDAGKPVAHAKVSAKNIATGQQLDAVADTAGNYDIPNIPPGTYDVYGSGEGFSGSVQHVMLQVGAAQRLDMKLAPALSLEGLGFPSSATKGSAEEQARLDKRSHMLKMHQRLGLITTIPLAATLLTGNMAGGRDTSSAGRNIHAILGASTAGLYFTSASYAIFAPRIPGTKPEGPIRLHKALAWIHGPGMVLTPILGAMAYQQKSDGERVHGIASAHGAVAITTAVAYGIAIWSVTVHSRRKSVRNDTADQP